MFNLLTSLMVHNADETVRVCVKPLAKPLRRTRSDVYPFEGAMALKAHATEANQPYHRPTDTAMVIRSQAQAHALIMRHSLFIEV